MDSVQFLGDPEGLSVPWLWSAFLRSVFSECLSLVRKWKQHCSAQFIISSPKTNCDTCFRESQLPTIAMTACLPLCQVLSVCSHSLHQDCEGGTVIYSILQMKERDHQERWSVFPKVTQLVSGRTRTWGEFSWWQRLSLLATMLRCFQRRRRNREGCGMHVLWLTCEMTFWDSIWAACVRMSEVCISWKRAAMCC